MSNIILAIISVILFYTGNVAISAWLMAFVLLKWKIESGDEGLYLENIEDYPDKELVTPTKYKFLFKNLEKVKECKENSLFTNIRIRKEFRNYLNQIRFLEQFQDYAMGDILEAVVNTYMEPHIDTLKKQSLLRKSL